MKIAPLSNISYGNYAGARRDSAPVVSHDVKEISFGAKGGKSGKNTFAYAWLAFLLVLPLAFMPFVNKSRDND